MALYEGFDSYGKSSYIASVHSEKGLENYHSGMFFKALESFNKCLMFAKPDSRQMSLAYECRSVVYFRVEEYQHCLENIKKVRDSGHPPDDSEGLNRREENCRELLKSGKSSGYPRDRFKLSYQANEKIPFIANCLELRRNEKFGRHIVTTRDLNPGEIIAIEEPLFKAVDASACHLRCFFCLKSNQMNLLPSVYTASAMFCSVFCENKATQQLCLVDLDSKTCDVNQRILFSALEICERSYEKLEQLMLEPKQSENTIFDFNEPLNPHNLLIAFNSLKQGPPSNEMDLIKSHPVLKLMTTEKERKFAVAFMQKTFRILKCNLNDLAWHSSIEHEVGTEVPKRFPVGTGVFIFASLFNHSCNHNIDRFMFENKTIFFVRKPIAKGQQLFVNYGPYYAQLPRNVRQNTLKLRYGFDCSCDACEDEKSFAFLDDHNWFRIKNEVIKDLAEVTDPDKKFKKNCEDLSETRNNMKSLKLMMKNMYLLALMAGAEPFIFYMHQPLPINFHE